LGITLLAFLLASLTPGDPAQQFLERATGQLPTPAQVVAERHALGLDKPLPIQYLSWLERLAHGNLGISYSSQRPVDDVLLEKIPATLEIALPAAFLALILGVLIGCISALYRNHLLDHSVRVLTLAGAAMPSFWLATLLVSVFAVQLHLVPVAGRGDFSSFILPIVTLAVAPTAVLARFTRSTVLETLGADYVRTARAKGLRRRTVVRRHALRNALIPVVTAFGISLGHLAAGAVIVETIFAWPGIGQLAVNSILERDYPVIQAFVLYTGALFIGINALIDITYGLLDPRIRLGSDRR
jgi:peptide/nickel transport system permease protein